MSPNTPPNTASDELDHLAGEYVRGNLSQATREAIERRMAAEPALAERVRFWEQDLLPLAAMAEPAQHDPAPASRSGDSIDPGNIDTHTIDTHTIDTTLAGPRGRSPRRNGWHSLPLWRAIAFGGIACTLALALILASMLAMSGARLMAPEPAPRFVAVLLDPRDKTPGWLVQAATAREIRLIPLGADGAPPDGALQLWTTADDWPAPVSLGLIEPGESLQVALGRLPPLQPDQSFEITLEPPAGSPTGRPTGPVVYVGRAVRTR